MGCNAADNCRCVFQSTLPARGATPFLCYHFRRRKGISIHAPRTGSDRRERGVCLDIAEFQSTLPARGATAGLRRLVRHGVISIHAPRTGSDRGTGAPNSRSFLFQSTLPARGATVPPRVAAADSGEFQSTLPARGATRSNPATELECYISIHAPRTGSDLETFAGTGRRFHFNPRSPHGERLSHCCTTTARPDFNPRSPHGERLDMLPLVCGSNAFQSTLPARGATSPCAPPGRWSRDFNPRSPHGERPGAS